MKSNTTHYLLILDRSGSMTTCLDDTLSGFNEQIQMIRDLQRRHPDQEFRVSLTTFNHLVDHPLVDVRVDDVSPLTTEQYRPDGCTALLDAIGEGVLNLKARRSAELDADEATAVVVILTDGHENASRLFAAQGISTLIRELEATDQWTFSFMGATRDALEVAKSMNIRAENAVHFNTSDMKSTMREVAFAMEDYAEDKAKGVKSRSFFRK
jgi:uncharacterized protein YegL